MRYSVMIVDDEESIRRLLKSRLEREGYNVVTASSAEEAEREFGAGTRFSTVVTDLKRPGKDGLGRMKSLRGKNCHTKFIVITGHGEKEAAVQAVKSGASDYLEKPFDLEDFTHAVKRCEKEYALVSENQDLLARLEARLERVEGKADDKSWYVSRSPAMSKVNDWLGVLKREAARTDAEEPTVLILGECGTGKEGIARQVMTNSRRAKGPWVAVNCANFNEQLLESELFGHEKGAFTGAQTVKRGLFEIAKGGTLFLDEIGEMDVKLQAKLLRVLQEKNFRRVGGTVDIDTDVRIVAATNANLNDKVKDGKFREDLYHRLSRVVLDVPALRERKEDIVPMARFFAEVSFKNRGKSFPGFTTEAEKAVNGYDWPGNVREMVNVMERVALINQGGHQSITTDSLSLPGRRGSVVSLAPRPALSVVQGGTDGGVATATNSGGAANFFDLAVQSGAGSEGLQFMRIKKIFVDQFETDYLRGMLSKHTGNVSAAAREAALDRSNFLRLLRRHQIKSQEFRPIGAEGDVADANDTGMDEQQAA